MAQPPASGPTALVFDWGNTLMRVFSEYTGPMSDWPQVSGIDGINEALEELKAHYPLYVATNASDSDAAQVCKALHRAGLGKYFQAVFTTRELDGARKPEERFFHQLESVLGYAPGSLVMVGDDYPVDMLGAKQAGWRALWYNPGHQPAPLHFPLHDREIDHMRDLPAALGRPWLPDAAVCLAWLAGRETPFNILTHVQLAAAVAYQLAVWIAQTGERVDPLLAHRGGLLHDIAKIDSIRQGKERGEAGDHAQMAYQLLLERGETELAEIASRHMVFASADYPRRPLTWEQKLVNYADKLAEGSRLASLEERLEALKERYPQFVEQLDQSGPLLHALQAEICARLGVAPTVLVDRLREALGL